MLLAPAFRVVTLWFLVKLHFFTDGMDPFKFHHNIISKSNEIPRMVINIVGNIMVLKFFKSNFAKTTIDLYVVILHVTIIIELSINPC